jgi:hypothetical protein
LQVHTLHHDSLDQRTPRRATLFSTTPSRGQYAQIARPPITVLRTQHRNSCHSRRVAIFNPRRNHMTNSNTGNSSSGSNSGGRQQGSHSSSDTGNRSGSKESQQDQSSSNKNSPGSTRGGTHEQHVKAGQQSHKNS